MTSSAMATISTHCFQHDTNKNKMWAHAKDSITFDTERTALPTTNATQERLTILPTTWVTRNAPQMSYDQKDTAGPLLFLLPNEITSIIASCIVCLFEQPEICIRSSR